MTATITIQLEIPADVNTDDLEQAIQDNLVSYAAIKHLLDYQHWLANPLTTPHSTEMRIAKHHELWADILEKAKWQITQ